MGKKVALKTTQESGSSIDTIATLVNVNLIPMNKKWYYQLRNSKHFSEKKKPSSMV